ncbi:hypothetical protein [Algoriphagus confluentis]|uniref:Uncharacterized protein n=1 Tax=Algoriphagus confluentis TaxID=1697556 RepID=A0ABQ6PQP6_9BACT|nr:hypothetical protein Aconfl_29180 [Algoriphagus confluentis]
MTHWNTPDFQRNYLKITALVIAAFGPVFFLGSMASTSEPARWALDFLSWPLDGVQTYAEPTTRFLSALTGGFLLGWGVTIWCLQKWVYPLAAEGVRKSVLFGTLSWFILDSSGSYLSGNPSNVLFNVLVLLIAVGPLWWPANS